MCTRMGEAPADLYLTCLAELRGNLSQRLPHWAWRGASQLCSVTAKAKHLPPPTDSPLPAFVSPRAALPKVTNTALLSFSPFFSNSQLFLSPIISYGTDSQFIFFENQHSHGCKKEVNLYILEFHIREIPGRKSLFTNS